MKHYYFENSRQLIKTYDFEVNTEYYPTYVALSNEQIDFINEHPTASFNEVKDCKLRSETNKINIDDVRNQLLENLSETSLSTINTLIQAYQVNNAYASLLSENGIYSTEKAKKIIDDYNRLGGICKEIFKKYEKLFNDCNEAQKMYDLSYKASIEYEDLIKKEKE